MKIALIVLLFLGGLGFFGFKAVSYFTNERDQAKARVEKLEKQNAEAKRVAAMPAANLAPEPLDPKNQQIEGKLPIDEVTIGNYVFKNRVAPEPPSFLRSENTRLLVERDQINNAWAWMGSQILSYKITELAKMYDKRQIEMDLEFVLVLLSTSNLKDRGISLFYDSRALWMDSLSLDGDAGSLRIASNGVALDLSFQDSKSGASVLSQPVVRCLDAIPWEFATDTDVPVPSSDVVDGVIRQSVEYRTIGFGLKGTVRTVGDSVVLDVEQRNGSVVTKPSGASSTLPEFSVQRLSTSLNLGFWEWSVLGGIQVDREELSRGIFRDKVLKSSDYLVIFVRPRLALDAPPLAVPVKQDKDLHPLLPMPDGIEPLGSVLPPPGWELDEKEFIKSRK